MANPFDGCLDCGMGTWHHCGSVLLKPRARLAIRIHHLDNTNGEVAAVPELAASLRCHQLQGKSGAR